MEFVMKKKSLEVKNIVPKSLCGMFKAMDHHDICCLVKCLINGTYVRITNLKQMLKYFSRDMGSID